MTKSGNLGFTVRKVNDETKVIKYDNIPQRNLYQGHGVLQKITISDSESDSSDLEWKIKEVRESQRT